jgi:hypothetical protein
LIKGWTEAEPYQFIRAGVIRLGEKNEQGRPQKLDYFVVPPEVAEIYGEKPRALDIVLPDETKFITASLKRYDGNQRLICHGDGEKAAVSLNRLKFKPEEYKASINGNNVLINGNQVEVTGTKEFWANINCPYQRCPHYKQGNCSEVVILYFCLTKIKGAALRTYTITTRSFNTFHHLQLAAEELRKRFGRCSFIPVQLRVKMEEKKVPGKNFKTEVPILYLDLQESYEEVWEKVLQGRFIWSLAPDNLPNAMPFIAGEAVNAEENTNKQEEPALQTKRELQQSQSVETSNETPPIPEDAGGEPGINSNPVQNPPVENPLNQAGSQNKPNEARIEFVVVDQPVSGKINGEAVAKVQIAFPSTREFGTLVAKGVYLKSLLNLNTNQKVEAKILPVPGKDMVYALQEVLISNNSQAKSA